jgi:hypothetical protein
MGRKPIGIKAMSDTERWRKWRDKQPRKPGSPEARDAQLRAENTRLRQRIAELEAAAANAAIKVDVGAAFSDKSKHTIADAIRIHRARLDKSFEQVVNAEVRKRIDAADDFVRQRLKEADRKIMQFEKDRGKRGVFSEAQYNKLLKVCHPDNSASDAVRAEIFDLIRRYKLSLINPEKKG